MYSILTAFMSMTQLDKIMYIYTDKAEGPLAHDTGALTEIKETRER